MDYEEWDWLDSDGFRALETLAIARELYVESWTDQCGTTPPWWENQTVATQRFFLRRAAYHLREMTR